MTEQERMKQGYVWQDDDENMNLQAHTKALVREFNSMPPEDMEGREALLHDIFGKVGKNVWIYLRQDGQPPGVPADVDGAMTDVKGDRSKAPLYC